VLAGLEDGADVVTGRTGTGTGLGAGLGTGFAFAGFGFVVLGFGGGSAFFFSSPSTGVARIKKLLIAIAKIVRNKEATIAGSHSRNQL
jgi:hypothetical protein